MILQQVTRLDDQRSSHNGRSGQANLQPESTAPKWTPAHYVVAILAWIFLVAVRLVWIFGPPITSIAAPADWRTTVLSNLKAIAMSVAITDTLANFRRDLATSGILSTGILVTT